MSFTYDFGAAPDISLVRLMCADTDSAAPVFQDAEVTAALFAESSQGLFASGQAMSGFAHTVPGQVYSHRRAAALLLDALASNKARLAAVNQILDVKLQVDAAAKALRDQAQAYRDAEANAGHFAIAEMVFDQFTARERLWKQLMRLAS
jgi:hypothetical protein